jgi:hypothetical protein
MYIYLNSETSKALFTNNSAADFIQKLPRMLTFHRGPTTPVSNAVCEWQGGHLDSGWEITLLDIKTPDFKADYKGETITVLCDICTVSYHENDLKPVLHVINRSKRDVGTENGINHIVTTPRYVNISSANVECIKVYLIDETGGPPAFTSGSLRCTLHIRPRVI